MSPFRPLIFLFFLLVFFTVSCSAEQETFFQRNKQHQPHLPFFNYDESLAQELMKFASVPYCDLPHVLSWNLSSACQSISSYQLDVVLSDASRDSLGLIAHNNALQTIIVSFKGTNPHKIEDWIDDLEGYGYYGEFCNITSTLRFRGHLGFCQYYLSLRNLGMLDQFVRIKSAFPTYQVYVIGHSLGGAAAAIFSVDVADHFGSALPNFQLLTYGQPRVGDISFVNLMAAYSAQQIWRVVHDVDVVPHLAPCCVASLTNNTCSPRSKCPFHIPTEIWYPQDSMVGAKYDVCSPTVGDDPKCSDSQINIIDWSISQHLTYFGQQVSGQCCLPSAKINSPHSIAKRKHKRFIKKPLRNLMIPDAVNNLSQ